MNDSVPKSGRMATTRIGYATQVRNAGVRDALVALHFGRFSGTSREHRVATATELLLDSCKRQARVLP
jgi:hypothetical protein